MLQTQNVKFGLIIICIWILRITLTYEHIKNNLLKLFLYFLIQEPEKCIILAKTKFENSATKQGIM